MFLIFSELFIFLFFAAATPHERIREVNELPSQGPKTVCASSTIPRLITSGPFEFIELRAEVSHTDLTQFQFTPSPFSNVFGIFVSQKNIIELL